MRKSRIIFIGLFLLLVWNASEAFAAVNDTDHEPIQNRAPVTDPQEAGTFGEFEVGLPGIPEGQTIDDFVADPKPILKFINLAVNAVIAVLVIIGLITIVIGGYIYMTAAGDGSKVKVAKEMIIAALAGIFLSLVSVIILNTINSYLGSGAEEPNFGTPLGASPGDSGGSGGSNGSGGGSGGGDNGSGDNGGGGSGGGNNGGIRHLVFNENVPDSTPDTVTIISHNNAVGTDPKFYIRDRNGVDQVTDIDGIVRAVEGTPVSARTVRFQLYKTSFSRGGQESTVENALMQFDGGINYTYWKETTQK